MLLRSASVAALAAPIALGALEAAALAPPSATREEPFVLRIAERNSAGGSVDRPVGVCVLRRRDEAGGTQLECELEFAREDARAMLIESSGAARREIVWREWRPGGGRTLHVTSDAAARRLELVDWGGPEAVRATLDSAQRVWTWLELAERARAGDLEPSRVALLDPLAREIVAVEVRVAWRADAGDGRGDPRLVRDVELVRDDGSSAGGFTFNGESCLALRWQKGPLRADRVTPDELAQSARDLGCEPRLASRATSASDARAPADAVVKDR